MRKEEKWNVNVILCSCASFSVDLMIGLHVAGAIAVTFPAV